MRFTNVKKLYKKIALALSLFTLILWAFLGTGASLAWFMDTSPEINNIFHAADFDLEIFQRQTDGSWVAVDSQTEIFDKEALYEPGYVQIAYLRVVNNGTVPFKFYTAVNVNGGFPLATNVFGQTFDLQEYLRFGITVSSSLDEMKNSIPDRNAAREIANMKLHNYSTDYAVLDKGACAYIAVIVRMPEEIGNVANYRGDTVPTIELGITVRADQITK